MIEQCVEEYRQFRDSLDKKEMDKRNLLVALLAPPSFNKTALVTDITETLHLPPLNRALVSAVNVSDWANQLEKRLNELPPHGYVLCDLPQSSEEATVVAEWVNRVGLNLQIVDLQDRKQDVKDKHLVDFLKNRGAVVHQLDATVSDNQIARNFFTSISPYCFEDKQLAEKYYEFRDICQELKIPHILISGACSYIYWGRRPLKDLDILVPGKENLQRIGDRIGQKAEHLVSSYADTNYLNVSEGVEVVSDLWVLSSSGEDQKRIPFAFDDLASDAQEIRFLGEKCTIMSPETLILFKFALGRFGIDQWGHHKDDYEDARGVLISQSVDLAKLRERAKQINALDRVVLGEKILGLSSD